MICLLPNDLFTGLLSQLGPVILQGWYTCTTANAVKLQHKCTLEMYIRLEMMIIYGELFMKLVSTTALKQMLQSFTPHGFDLLLNNLPGFKTFSSFKGNYN